MNACETCRFWKQRESVTGPVTVPYGDCRRHAPIGVALELTKFVRPAWPMTDSSDGCGDHEPDTSKSGPTTAEVAAAIEMRAIGEIDLAKRTLARMKETP